MKLAIMVLFCSHSVELIVKKESFIPSSKLPTPVATSPIATTRGASLASIVDNIIKEIVHLLQPLLNCGIQIIHGDRKDCDAVDRAEIPVSAVSTAFSVIAMSTTNTDHCCSSSDNIKQG